MKTRIVVLRAGFGGLELSTLLSETLGDSIDLTSDRKSEAFIFGYSKLDGCSAVRRSDAVRLPTATSRNRASASEPDDYRDRPCRAARHHRSRHLRGRLPDRGTRRRYDMEATPGLAGPTNSIL